MEVVTGILVAFVAWTGTAVSSYDIPGSLSHTYFNYKTANIEAELGSLLSPNATIIYRTDFRFGNATERWQEYKSPSINIVVEVATESDVQETIRYANKRNVQFLAMTGGHGATNALAGVKHGIEIWMRQLNSITIAPDGQTATIGGGVLSKEITDALWSAKKQTVTGWCECTGAIAPLLGGGHGLLQGQYGLLADNLISAQLVLANGTTVTASSTSHPDLFWAIRGAGHNFGVVTKIEYKIYDVPADDSWTYSMFIFTGDKVEAVFEQMNKMTQDENEVAEIINYSLFAWNPAIDSHGPVHIFFILYHGPASEEQKYSAPFQAIGAAVTQTGTITYPELPALVGNGNNDLACGHGFSILRFPIKMKTYNIQAQRAVYDRFTELTTQIPELNNSFFLFEGYSVRAVKAVPEESTVFAHRQDNLLIAPVMLYTPNSTLDATAIKAGKELRQILHDADESSELHAYVNYAHGDETLQEVYGFEEWRQQRLKVLKAEYDPSGKFNYYVPIY